MHRFYAPPSSFEAGLVTLGEHEAHHLREVLRHSAGDEVLVFDGIGGEYRCRMESAAKKSATLTVIACQDPSAPESPLDLTVAAALLKGDKFDQVVKKCTEIGVSRIVPLITDRCDVRPKDGEKKRDRWQKIVIDASRQCGRATAMAVSEPLDFKRYLAEAREKATRIIFSERGGKPFESVASNKCIAALIGPEGGWSDQELSFAAEQQVTIITLRGRILRAETACISIAAILQHRFGDLN